VPQMVTESLGTFHYPLTVAFKFLLFPTCQLFQIAVPGHLTHLHYFAEPGPLSISHPGQFLWFIFFNLYGSVQRYIHSSHVKQRPEEEMMPFCKTLWLSRSLFFGRVTLIRDSLSYFLF
jgi:hypothetical protein